MTASALLSRLREDGFTVSDNGGRIKVIPASRLAEADRAYLQQLKPEVLELLAGESISLPEPNLCPRCLTLDTCSTGREGQNVSHPGQHRPFHCVTDDNHVWLVFRNGVVAS